MCPPPSARTSPTPSDDDAAAAGFVAAGADGELPYWGNRATGCCGCYSGTGRRPGTAGCLPHRHHHRRRRRHRPEPPAESRCCRPWPLPPLALVPRASNLQVNNPRPESGSVPEINCENCRKGCRTHKEKGEKRTKREERERKNQTKKEEKKAIS